MRVLAPSAVSAARAATERAVVRPARWEDARELLHPLAARRPVLVQLDGLSDTARRRAFDFMMGVACGVDAAVSDVDSAPHAYLFDPVGGATTDHGAPRVPSTDGVTTRSGAPAGSTPEICVLCDLRAADRTFAPKLDMVLERDGTRIWAPRAAVCRRCRASIRHWRFSVGWCSECERWGRRGVTSPCGIAYGP